MKPLKSKHDDKSVGSKVVWGYLIISVLKYVEFVELRIVHKAQVPLQPDTPLVVYHQKLHCICYCVTCGDFSMVEFRLVCLAHIQIPFPSDSN